MKVCDVVEIGDTEWVGNAARLDQQIWHSKQSRWLWDFALLHQHLGEGGLFEKFLQRWCFFCGDDGTLWSRCGCWLPPVSPVSPGYRLSKPEAKTITGGLTMPSFAARGIQEGKMSKGGIGCPGWPLLDAPPTKITVRGWQWEIPCYNVVYWLGMKISCDPCSPTSLFIAQMTQVWNMQKFSSISFQGVPIKPCMLNWHPATKILLRQMGGSKNDA